jgi:hypothetical protein
MAKDADQIVVGANGTIRVAPVGTAAPATEVAVPAGGWVDLGLVSEDGVTFSVSKTTEDIPVWQLFYAARKVVTGAEASAAFVLRQWSKDTTELALGGVVTEPTPDHFKFTPASAEDVDERALLVDWTDGDKHYRLVIPRGVVSEGVETNITKGSAADLPVTFAVLGTDGVDPWYLLTDDPSFAA